ncbi:MAG: hypothetical protein PHN55_15970 [Dysgonamonadaceae bacterium]|nr:hypothetical protein [Dysgonamonadaceae bacterium]
MKHKEKGTYINYVNGKYYLYAAHSERVPGTKKVKRIFDGYIGRITEEDGLILTKDKVSGTVSVYEYGLSTLLLGISKEIHKGFKRSFKNNADFIITAAILTVIYDKYNNYLLQQSYLSIHFPDMNMDISTTEDQRFAIERGVRVLNYEMNEKYASEAEAVKCYFSHLYKVKINGKYYLSDESQELLALKKKYNIEWSD